jgi:hypothetical protein
MISESMLSIFAKFNGDIDGFARGAATVERQILDERTWYQISALLQELGIVASGLAAPAYEESVEARLLAESSTSRVAELMRQLASTQLG